MENSMFLWLTLAFLFIQALTFSYEWSVVSEIYPFDNFMVVTPKRLLKNKKSIWFTTIIFRIFNPIGTIGLLLYSLSKKLFKNNT